MLDLQEDTSIRLRYITSKYAEELKTWRLPNLTLKPDLKVEVSYVRNLCDFKNCYFNYVKRGISVAVVTILLFSVLFYGVIVNTNLETIIIGSALILGIIAIVIGGSISQYKRYKKIYQAYLQENLV